MNRRQWYLCALALVFLYLATALIVPLTRGESPIRLGSDLSGGVLVTYRPDFTRLLDFYQDMTREEILSIAKENLAARLQRTLKIIPDVVVRDNETIIVNLPAGDDQQRTLDLVGKTYQLTLRLVIAAHDRAESFDRIAEVLPYQDRYLELAPPEFSGDMLDPGSIRVESGASDTLVDLSPKVGFRFASPYDVAFEDFTREHTGRWLAILLDDQVEWAGVIEGAIRGNAVLAGGYTLEEATEITAMLRSGTLPVSLDVESLSTIGPSLGQAIQEMGLRAMWLALGGLALLLTLSYMHRPWFLLASMGSLACLLFLITGLAAVFKLTLDVVGIAGIILSVGMGMDGCILVLEALGTRLDRLDAKTIAVHYDGIVRAVYSFASEGRTLFHANATTLLVVALLLATERLKSFSLFMLVGIGASLLTILMTREILPRIYGWIPDRGLDVLGWLRRTRVGLFRARKPFIGVLLAGLVLSGLLLLPGAPGGSALDLGPDFRAGTQLVVRTPEDESLRAGLHALEGRLPGVGIRHQALGSPEDGRHLITIGTAVAKQLDEGAPGHERPTTGELFSILSANSLDVESLSSIDEKVSARRVMTGLSVLVLSFFLLAVYLVLFQEPLNRLLSSTRGPSSPKGTRARIFVGIMLAIALDVAVMLAVISLLHLPISLAVVAGIVTVIGYSVNDSVVLWCHIQSLQTDLEREKKTMRPLGLITTAIDRVSSRALLTTASTVLPPLTILAVGLTPLADFAWVVIAGTVTGTLSSIFVVGSFARRALEQEPSLGRSGIL